MQRAPQAASQMLIGLDFLLGPTPEIVLVEGAGSEDPLPQASGVQRHFLGNRALAYRNLAESDSVRSEHLEPLFQGKTAPAQEKQLFVCQNGTCQAPITGRSAIEQAITAMVRRESPNFPLSEAAE
jgi:uncharacterized protein